MAWKNRILMGLAAMGWALLHAAGGVAAPGAGAVSFSRDVAPILLNRCQACHGAEKSKGKYRVDSFERLMAAGGSKDASIVAGKPNGSAVYRLITAKDEDDRMPQKADTLPAVEVQVIKRWIEEGAKFDGPDRGAALASYAEDREHVAAPRHIASRWR